MKLMKALVALLIEITRRTSLDLLLQPDDWQPRQAGNVGGTIDLIDFMTFPPAIRGQRASCRRRAPSVQREASHAKGELARHAIERDGDRIRRRRTRRGHEAPSVGTLPRLWIRTGMTATTCSTASPRWSASRVS